LQLATTTAERAQRGLSAAAIEGWNQIARAAIAQIPDRPAEDGNPLTQLPSAAPVVDLRRAALGHEGERAARAQAEATRLAVTIRSNVREAYQQYRIAHDLALQAEQTLQLRVAAQEDMLLRYNGMLKSTWDLLTTARDRVAGEAAAVEALRDFWLAHANLQAVLAGGDYSGPDAIGTGGARNNAGGGH
ncbi:MAG: TolC family protein, partial [Betaproteobacteria bacterium HGW-Betaproteobacteria-21]